MIGERLFSWIAERNIKVSHRVIKVYRSRRAFLFLDDRQWWVTRQCEPSGSQYPMTTPTDTPLALNPTDVLQQAIAHQFSARPTLRSVVSELLEKSLKSKLGPWGTLPPLDQLNVVWTVDQREHVLSVPRQHVLLEAVLGHIACATPLYYTYYEPQQCFLAQVPVGEVVSVGAAPLLPMTTVEQVIRVVLREWRRAFQAALVDYWNQPTGIFRSRQHWLVTLLRGRLLSSVNTRGWLSDEQIAVVRQVLKYPVIEDRLRVFNASERPTVYFAQFQVSQAGAAYTQLSPDLLIAHQVDGREQVMQCKPSGAIEPFATWSAYGRVMGRVLGSSYLIDSLTWKRYEPSGDCLHTQTMILLNNQLEEVAAIKPPSGANQCTVELLERQLADITDLSAVFNEESESDSVYDAAALGRVFTALPQWLQQASAADRFAYRSHVIDLANVLRNAKGRAFNDGIEDLHTYASKVLREQMLKDQPLAPGYYSDDIELDFLVASGAFGTAGSVRTVTFTLTELALQNLAAIPSGHMTIRHRHNQLIQDWWMTPAYVRSLIQRVDVGARYPALIKRLLLDEADESVRREVLFVDQLRVTLPMLALESVLKGAAGLTVWGYRCIGALMQEDAMSRVLDGKGVCISPLAWLSRPKAVPDYVRNMFVIGLTDNPGGRCVLYRPLYKAVLLEFTSAQALLEAIRETGPLRSSVLDWMSETSRATMESGVLSLVNVGINATETFYLRPLRSQFLHDLYMENTRALIELADRQSVSNTESRWATLKEGGWLLFNTVLPFLRGPVAVFSWIVLTFSALQNDIKALGNDQEGSKAPAIIDLLFNIGLVLLHVTQSVPPKVVPVSEEESLAAQFIGPQPRPAEAAFEPDSVKVEQGPVYFSSVAVGNQHSTLDFSWFNNPRIHFNETQLTWLDSNRGRDPGGRAPVAQGQYKGLYVIDGRWHAVIRGHSYEVYLADEGVVLINPRDPTQTGPWIRQDATGKWDFDTGMRLRGGGPKTRRELAAQQALRNKRINELNNQEYAFYTKEQQIHDELDEARKKAIETQDNDLSKGLTYLEKTLRVKNLRSLAEKGRAEFAVQYANFKERHALMSDVKDHIHEGNFNEAFFDFATDIVYAQHLYLIHLIALYPEFAGRAEEIMARNEGARYANFRRELFKAQQQHLNDFREQVRLLDVLRESPRVGYAKAETRTRCMARVARPDGTLQQATELDFMSIYMGILTDIVPKEIFGAEWQALREIIWPLTFSLQTHAQLSDTSLFTHHERVEILTDLHERYARAQDSLAILHLEVGDKFNLTDYNRLTELIEEFSLKVEQQLADENRRETEWLPSQPNPSRHVRLLSRIIKTRKNGVLIGVVQPRTSDQEPLVVKVGESRLSEPADRPMSPGATLPKMDFRESSPNYWEAIEPKAAPAPVRALGAIRTQCNELLSNVDPKINRVKVYAKNSKFPLELEEILEREALKLDALIGELERGFPDEPVQDKPKSGTPQSLLKRLREGAQKLREQALWILKSLPPTEATVDFLLHKGDVHLHKEGGRIKMFGPRNDFVQEYQVLNKKNQVVWYAHLHYATLEAPDNTPTSAHFKLKDQRKASKQSLEAKAKPGEKVPEVYYGKISQRMIVERFLL